MIKAKNNNKAVQDYSEIIYTGSWLVTECNIYIIIPFNSITLSSYFKCHFKNTKFVELIYIWKFISLSLVTIWI